MIRNNRVILKPLLLTMLIVVVLKLCLVFLWPFLFALIIVLVMEPMIKHLIHKGFKRKGAVVITFFTYSLVGMFFIFYVWSYASNKVIEFIDNIPSIVDTYKNYPFLAILNENYENILVEVKSLLLEYKGKIFHTIINTINWIVYFFIIILSSIFMSIDLPYLSRKVKDIFGNSIYIPIKKSLFNVNKLISIEFKLVGITTIITTISFYLLGFKDAFSIGIICGILDLLPIVGPALVFLPMLIYFLTTKQLFISIGVITTYILILIVRQFIEIKLMQGNLVLKPIFIVFSLYCGVLVFGAFGVLFGPLVLIIFKEIHSSVEKGDIIHT